MEAIILVALLVALGLLATRYGHDSRAHLRSREDELAASGYTWGEGGQAASAGGRRQGRRRGSGRAGTLALGAADPR
jgi:hypothetical protein